MVNESTGEDQIRRLQLCINDLISVQALPAIWSGQGSSHIVATLLDMLVRVLSLDFAFARLSDSFNEPPAEFVRVARCRSAPPEPSEIGRFLDRWLTRSSGTTPLSVPNPLGNGEVRIARFRLGVLEEIGMLIICSQRADFPTQIEMLLLRVAANQAVVALHEARRVSEQKRAAEELERHIVERTAQLTHVKDELAEELRGMSGLHALSTRLLAKTQKESILEEVLNATIALQSAEMGCAQLYNSASGRLEIVAQHGFERHFLKHFRICHAESTISGRAFARRERVIVEDVLADALFAPHQATAHEGGYRAVQSTPMLSRNDEPLGVISTFFRKPHRPSERELRLTDLYGRQAAGLIERTQAEEALRQSEEKYRTLFESIDEGFCIIEMLFDGNDQPVDYRFLEVSPSFEKQTGIQNARGRKMREIAPQHERHWFERYGRIALTGVPERFESEAAQLHRWYDVYAFRVGEPRERKVALLFNDITERKRAEEAVRKGERELRAVIETMPAMAWSALPDGSSIFVNRRWTEYTGLSGEATSGSGWHAAVHPQDLVRHIEKWRVSVATAQPFEDEARFRRGADGEYRWFLVRGLPLRDEHGQIVKWYGILTDIDDRKRAESLLAGENRILEMVAKGNSLAEILDALCRLAEEHSNRVLASILLLEGDHLWHGGAPNLPKAYTDAINGCAIGPSVGSCGTAAYRGEQVIVEDIATDPLWADFRALALLHSLRACWSTPVFSSQGKVIATFALYYLEPRSPSPREQEIIQQITHLAGVAIERNQTQEALRRSEAYLAEAQKLTRTGSWSRDQRTNKLLHCSEEIFRIFELDRQASLLTAEDLFQRVHPEDRERMRDRSLQVFLQKKGNDAEYRLLLPDGTIKHVRSIREPILNSAGEVVELLGTAIDITDLKRAEEGLRERAELLNLSSDAIFVRDLKNVITYWNRGAQDLYGWTAEQTVGKFTSYELLKTVFPIALEKIETELLNTGRWTGELLHTRRDGTQVFVASRWSLQRDARGAPVAVLESNRDITGRKEAEEALRKAQAALTHVTRITTLGEVSASLAHELNQPLTAIVNNVNACLDLLPGGTSGLEEVRDALADVVNDADRASVIIERVRRMARRSAPEQAPLRLADVVDDVLALAVTEAAARRVRIYPEVPADLPLILGDRVQLQQVLLNLLVNAMDAMSSVQESARRIDIIGKPATHCGEPAVQIRVCDCGIGFDSGQAERLFETFYTTKPQGMGLGLAICRSIIEAHGGRLWAESNNGPGATFTFCLPTLAEART